MRNALSMSLVAFALVFGLFGCGAASNNAARDDRGSETDPVDLDDGGGANPDVTTSAGSVLDAATLCDASPDFGFQIAAAATVPSFEGDLAAGPLGESGAQSLAADLTSGETFCDVDVDSEIQDVIDEADLLVGEGRMQDAQTLIAGLLTDPSFGLSAKRAVSASLTGAADTRRRVNGLLAVAAWKQKHLSSGSDDTVGQDEIQAAAKVFDDWASAQLEDSTLTIRELLTLAAEAQLLGDDLSGISDEALERVADIALQQLQDALAAFDPCTANVQAIKDLLGALALAQLIGVETGGESEEALELIAQAARVMGDEALEQLVGGENVDGAICNGLRLVASAEADGGAVVTVDLGSCDSTNWTGIVNVGGSAAGAPLNLSGTVEFVTPEGGGTVETTATVTGTVSIGGEALAVTDPLSFIFTVDLDDGTASVQVASTGAGTIVLPFLGASTFASVFSATPTIPSGSLTENPDCPQNN